MLNNLQRAYLHCLNLLLLTLLCISFSVFAQSPKMKADRDRSIDKQPKSHHSAKLKGSPRSFSPYVPSEKVSADKTVSFPADI